jgi:hypothetical protein
MEGELRFFVVWFFYLCFLFLFALLGLLFDLHSGAIIGAGVGFIILLFVFKYGEKIILLLAKARYVSDDDKLVNQVKNFCTHLEINEVKIYWSHTYYNNIYYVNSYWGTPSIIIGKESYKLLSRNELNSLIYTNILRAISPEAKHRTTINVLTFIIFSWVFFIQNLFENENLKQFANYFLYPAFYLKSKFYKQAEKREEFEKQMINNEFMKRDYISAIFKISKLPICKSLSFGTFVLSGISHTDNIGTDLLYSSLLDDSRDIESRVRELTSSLK